MITTISRTADMLERNSADLKCKRKEEKEL